MLMYKRYWQISPNLEAQRIRSKQGQPDISQHDMTHIYLSYTLILFLINWLSIYKHGMPSPSPTSLASTTPPIGLTYWWYVCLRFDFDMPIGWRFVASHASNGVGISQW